MTVYDTDVPVPKGGSTKSSGDRNIMEEMPIGASYFFPDDSIKRLNCIAYRIRPKRFTMRKLRKNGTDGVRVWRLDDGD